MTADLDLTGAARQPLRARPQADLPEAGMAKLTWIAGRVDVLLAALDDSGMSVSRAAAAELICERVEWVSSQMRLTPATAKRYLTDDALSDLACKRGGFVRR
jgi:hypothetical protein